MLSKLTTDIYLNLSEVAHITFIHEGERYLMRWLFKNSEIGCSELLSFAEVAAAKEVIEQWNEEQKKLWNHITTV